MRTQVCLHWIHDSEWQGRQAGKAEERILAWCVFSNAHLRLCKREMIVCFFFLSK